MEKSFMRLTQLEEQDCTKWQPMIIFLTVDLIKVYWNTSKIIVAIVEKEK